MSIIMNTVTKFTASRKQQEKATNSYTRWKLSKDSMLERKGNR